VIASGLNPDACTDGDCPVRTEITLIPCTQNFEDQVCRWTTAQFTVYDEQEDPQSASEEVCWFNQDLSSIGDGGNTFGTISSRGTFLKTVIGTSGTRCIAGPDEYVNDKACDSDDDCGGAANGGVCGPSPGLLGIVEEFHNVDLADPNTENPFANLGTAATVMHMTGSRSGFCRGNPEDECDSDADCDEGRCRIDGVVCDEDEDCDNTGSTAALNRCDLCIIDSIDVPEVVPFPPAPAP
jgi:hypothetical protein